MKITRLISAVALLSLALTLSPTHGVTQSQLPVAVVPNSGDVENIDRAVFSPDARLVATLDGFVGRRVKIWDVASGRPLRTLEYEAYFNAVTFSPDGTWIASAHKDGTIKLWDVATGANAATLQAERRRPRGDDASSASALWIDAKGDLLVSGDDAGLITVWSIAKRNKLRSFKFGKIPDKQARPKIIALRMTADRTRLIAVTEASIKVFDINRGEQIAAFDLPNQYPLWQSNERYTLAEDSIIGDDEVIARHTKPGCELDELVFVSLKDTKNLVTVDKPARCDKPKDDDSFSYGRPTIFSGPGRQGVIIARSGFPELKQWDPQTRRVARTTRWPDDASARIIGLDRDFRVALSHDAGTVSLREFDSGAVVRALASYEYSADNVIASKDGHHILLSHDPSRAEPQESDIALWQVDALNPKRVRVAVDKDATILDFSPGAMLALAATENGDIVLFSTETGIEQRRFSVPGVKSISRASLSPDGKLVALVGADANDTTVAVLVNADDGTIRLRFGGRDERNGMIASTGRDDDSDMVTAVAFSRDGANVAIGRWNGTAEVWSTQRAQRIRMLPAAKNDADQIWSLAFSNDGGRLIAGSRDSGVFLWDVASGRLVRTFERDSLAGHVHVASVALSHDRKLVAAGLSMHAVSSGDTGAENGIKVWDAITGRLRFTLRGHDGGVGALAFSSDDQCIVSASFDGTIRYWNSTTGKWAATVTMARDGRWIVITESGFFAGSPGGDDFIDVVRGLKSVPVSRFRDQLYRPDLVEQVLTGDHERRYRDAARELNKEKMWESASPP